MKKKFLALLLAFVMVAGMLPLTALADTVTTPENLNDVTDITVVEIGAFTTADAFNSYINGTYYMNGGAGITDAADGTMYALLSGAVPTDYKLLVYVRSGDDSTQVNIQYIDAGKSFAYFANDAFKQTNSSYNVRVGLYKESDCVTESGFNLKNVYWYNTTAKNWAKAATAPAITKTVTPSASQVAAPVSITVTESGLSNDATGTIAWTNAVDNKALKGAPVSFTITAPDGYTVESVKAGDATLTATNNKYTFTATENVTVAVTYKAATAPTTITVVPAPLEDHSDQHLNELGTVTATATKGEGKNVTVNVTGTNIKAHTNAQGTKGTWVGFGMPIEDGKTYVYTLGDSSTPITSIPDRKITVDAKQYNTVYFDTTGNYVIKQYEGSVANDMLVAIYNVAVTITPYTPVTPAEDGPVFTIPASGTFEGKNYSDLQTGTGTITKSGGNYVFNGLTLKKITEPWTAFNNKVVSEQTGYYVVFAVPKTATYGGVEKTITSMKLPGHAADGSVVEKALDASVFTDDGNTTCHIIMHVGAADATVSAVTGKTFSIKLTYDGQTETTYTFSCSGVTPEGAAADPTPVTPPSGGGGGSTTTTPPVTTDKTDGTTSTTVKPSVKDETASVTVNNSTANALVNKTVQDKTDNAVIEVKPETGKDVTEVKAEIPAKAVANLADKTDASLTVATPVANVTISNDALAGVSKDAKTVAVTAAAKTDESTGETTYEVAVLKDGKPVDELNGELKVALPVDEKTAEAGAGLVAVLVDENGNETIITKSVLTEDGQLVMALDTGTATVKYVDNSREYADEIPTWAADAVQFTSSRQLFMGVSENDFGANTTMNRAMLVTVLHRLEGEPAPTKPAGFQDVTDDSWYAASAAWSAEMGIVAGTENGFDGNRPITRQDLALMLYRYANVYGSGKGASADYSHMGGAEDVADYAAEAMRWAVGSGIIAGDENNNLDPQSPTTRAQVSVMLMRFVELLAAK